MNAQAELLAAGIARHQSGDLAGAVGLYQQLLAEVPDEPNALHLLGLIAQQQGRASDAVELISRAARQVPANAALEYNLAGALLAAGDTGQAIARYRAAVRLKPDFAEAWQNLGALLERLDRLDEAADCFERLIGLAPRSAEAHFSLARVRHRQRLYEAAIEHGRRAVELDGSHRRAFNQWAASTLAAGHADKALALHRERVARFPNDGASWANLGRALHESGDLARAHAAYQQAINLDPRGYETHVNLSALLRDAERYDEALALLRNAIGLKPARAIAFHQLGRVFEEQGRFDEALAAFDEALARDPRDGETRMCRAQTLLQNGRYADGWNEYESRWQARDAYEKPSVGVRAWQGEPLEGQSIAILPEQGLGDEIMFATCYPDIIARAARTTIVCDPRLEPLLARSFPQARVVGASRAEISRLRIGDVDCEAVAGSLPGRLRREERHFPRQNQLLQPDASRRESWRRRLDHVGPGLKVGISWRAGTTPRHRRQRTTRLSDWLPVLSVPGVQLVNLQYGDTHGEVAECRAAHNRGIATFDDCDSLRDLDDFAALVSALDLVVSVGNATVHLAGALGTRCWAVLPKRWGWRWGTNRADTPWYASVRLVRQANGGDWKSLFAALAAELQELAEQGNAPIATDLPLDAAWRPTSPHVLG